MSTLTDGLEDDFELLDELEAATYLRLNEDGTTAQSVAVPQMFWLAAKCDMVLGDRLVAASEIRIGHLPVAVLTAASLTPRKGDVAVDAQSVRRVVYEFEVMSHRTRYRVITVRE